MGSSASLWQTSYWGDYWYRFKVRGRVITAGIDEHLSHFMAAWNAFDMVWESLPLWYYELNFQSIMAILGSLSMYSL